MVILGSHFHEGCLHTPYPPTQTPSLGETKMARARGSLESQPVPSSGILRIPALLFTAQANFGCHDPWSPPSSLATAHDLGTCPCSLADWLCSPCWAHGQHTQALSPFLAPEPVAAQFLQPFASLFPASGLITTLTVELSWASPLACAVAGNREPVQLTDQ